MYNETWNLAFLYKLSMHVPCLLFNWGTSFCTAVFNFWMLFGTTVSYDYLCCVKILELYTSSATRSYSWQAGRRSMGDFFSFKIHYTMKFLKTFYCIKQNYGVTTAVWMNSSWYFWYKHVMVNWSCYVLSTTVLIDIVMLGISVVHMSKYIILIGYFCNISCLQIIVKGDGTVLEK